MSSGPRNLTFASKAIAAEQSLRTSLRPTAPTTRDAGYVDGASWDLATGLPAPLDSLAVRLDAVHGNGRCA